MKEIRLVTWSSLTCGALSILLVFFYPNIGMILGLVGMALGTVALVTSKEKE